MEIWQIPVVFTIGVIAGFINTLASGSDYNTACSLLTNADSDCRLDETGRTQQITLNSELPTFPLLQLLAIVPQLLHPDFPLDGGILESFHISLLYENDLIYPTN